MIKIVMTVLVYLCLGDAAMADPVTLAAVGTSLASAAGTAGTVAATAGSTLAAALPSVSTLSALGSVVGIGSTLAQGAAANSAAKQEAQMRERQAAEERAGASKAAQDERRRTQLALSKQRAIAAGSGAGTINPTILDIMSETEAEGDYNARSEVWAGQSRADGQLDQAAAARARGKAARTSSWMEAFGQSVDGVGDFKKLRMQGY